MLMGTSMSHATSLFLSTLCSCTLVASCEDNSLESPLQVPAWFQGHLSVGTRETVRGHLTSRGPSRATCHQAGMLEAAAGSFPRSKLF